jgi:hypothetical protein
MGCESDSTLTIKEHAKHVKEEVDRLNGLIEIMSGAALGERRPEGDA